MDVKKALELYQEAKELNHDTVKAFREDVRFSIGLDHYTDEEIDARGEANCMVVPILPQFIHQVVNDMRMSTPSIHVIPGDIKTSEGAAKTIRGLIRDIEYKSKADEVYDTGGEYAVRGGIGYARVDHDYVSEDSFLQDLKLVRVQNPASVMLGRYVECDGSDAEYGIVLDTISKTEFERLYPGKDFVSFDTERTDPQAKEITIAEVFVKEYETVKKQMAEDGSMEDYAEDSKRPTRTLKKIKIGRYKFSGKELLEETTFPGKYIPLVPFHGEEVWVDGKRNLLSLIRLAKDAQRRVNKWASKESEILDMAPVAPILAPLGSVENIPDGWDGPDGTIVLRYRQTDKDGNPLNKPERLAPPPIPTGIINAMQGAKENVKEALGMYNAALGQKSNAISGVAYDAQKTEADVATFHFSDNRNRSIQHIGRILVSAIPEVYDTARIIRILGEEDVPQMVGINGEMVDGQEEEFDLRTGSFDVKVTTGPSYTTKRQETAAMLGDLIKQDPEAKMIFGDLWAKNLDVAGAESIAARFKKIIPPHLTANEKEVDPQVMQLTQALQQAQAQIQQLAMAVESKQGEEQLKAGELAIKQQELKIKEMELQIKAAEAQKPEGNMLEAEKLAFEQSIKDREMALKEAEFQLKVMQAQQQEQPVEKSQPTSIKLDTTGFQFSKTPEQEQMEAEEMMIRQQMELEKQQREDQEMQMKAAQGEALLQMLATIAQQLGAIAQQANQPKRVVRDESGAIVGVQ